MLRLQALMTPARAGACALPRWCTCGGTHSAALGRASDARITLARCRKVTAEAAGKRYAQTSTADSGAGRHEKSLSCKPGACGDDRSACNGGGLAVQGATAASGSVLRLVRRLRRPQRRRDALQRHSPFPVAGSLTPDVTTGDHDAIFGIHAGAQWQWGAWVLGAELARSGCSHECRSTSSVLPVAQGFEENIFGEHKIIDLFTAGARLGYAWDRLLVFATGGFASAHIENAHC